MNEDQALSSVYFVGAIVLVVSGLAARRLPLGQTLKMAMAWVAIFGAGFLLFALRDDFGAIGQRLKAEAIGSPIESQGELRIPMAADGHFWADAELNGEPVRFLVDSGATMTTVGAQTARRAKLSVSPNKDQAVQTGNGTIMVAAGRASSLRIGSIERTDIAVQVADGDDFNVIGMNFLATLRRWSVEGRWLVLSA